MNTSAASGPDGSAVNASSDPPDAFARRGAALAVKTSVVLKSGYHVNSNTPSESYLIPLRLIWERGALETVEVVFPKPHIEKYEFSENPLSVFTGDFELVTKFKVAANAPGGIRAPKTRAK